MKWLLCILLASSVQSVFAAEDMSRINYLPPDGVAEDQRVAIAIADVVLSSLYGKEHIRKQRPLKATLIQDNVWRVVGRFPGKRGDVGGVAEVLVRKSDGAVLGMMHGK